MTSLDEKINRGKRKLELQRKLKKKKQVDLMEFLGIRKKQEEKKKQEESEASNGEANKEEEAGETA